jgi:hypothetical protein
MKKLIILCVILLSSCVTQHTCNTYVSKDLIYSDYESEGGFNYLEDAVIVFDTIK